MDGHFRPVPDSLGNWLEISFRFNICRVLRRERSAVPRCQAMIENYFAVTTPESLRSGFATSLARRLHLSSRGSFSVEAAPSR